MARVTHMQREGTLADAGSPVTAYRGLQARRWVAMHFEPDKHTIPASYSDLFHPHRDEIQGPFRE